MRFKYAWLLLIIATVIVIMFAGNVMTVRAPEVEPTNTEVPSSNKEYTLAMYIEETQVTIRPDETIAEFFSIPQSTIQAELQKWEGKAGDMPISITLEARSAQYSMSQSTTVANIGEKMPIFVWSNTSQYPIDTQASNVKGMTFLSVTATIQFGDQTKTVIRTYDSKTSSNQSHPGTFRVIDTRPNNT